MRFETLSAANEDRLPDISCAATAVPIWKMPLALAGYIKHVSYLRDTLPEDAFLSQAGKEMKKLVLTENLLRDDQMTGCEENYKRHQLYVDPEGRFTILALVWKPGQFSCVHGHSAWGVVGVHRGEIQVDCFDSVADPENPAALIQTNSLKVGRGAVDIVTTAPDGIHRLVNASDETAITIHTYGMDLSENPASINVVYAD